MDIKKLDDQLRQNLDEYKQACLMEGLNIEDIVDDMERIMSVAMDKWLDEDPIVLNRL